jgi:hypothetical protein
MDAAHSILRHILEMMLAGKQLAAENNLDLSTAEGVDEAYEQADECIGPFASQEVIEIQDAIEEFRCSGQETDLSCKEYSRHYECDQVAAKLSDGQYVSWVYWYGGGKHGEPSAIDWMGDAFFVSCEEKQVMTTVYEFSVKDATPLPDKQ